MKPRTYSTKSGSVIVDVRATKDGGYIRLGFKDIGQEETGLILPVKSWNEISECLKMAQGEAKEIRAERKKRKRGVAEHCVKCQNEGAHEGEHVMEGQE